MHSQKITPEKFSDLEEQPEIWEKAKTPVQEEIAAILQKQLTT
jgi:hypothetical protein